MHYVEFLSMYVWKGKLYQYKKYLESNNIPRPETSIPVCGVRIPAGSRCHNGYKSPQIDIDKRGVRRIYLRVVWSPYRYGTPATGPCYTACR